VVEREAVEHLAHIEADFAADPDESLSDLLEHCVVVDVDFYEWSIVAIDKCQIAICAEVRAAIRERNELVIGIAADVRAELAVETPHKRRRPADHQSPLAGKQRLGR